MKFASFICLLVVMLTQICQKICVANEANLQSVLEECQAEHDISESQLAELEGQLEDPSAVNMNTKCFGHCLVKGMGYLDEDSKLDGKKFLDSQIIKNIWEHIISGCKDMHDMTDDPCEYIFNLFNCIAI